MKTILSREQSSHLIELGVDEMLASEERVSGSTNQRGWGGQIMTGRAVFTISDLLSILPEATRDLGGIIFGFAVERGTWVAEYDDCPDSCKYGEELIDALYQLLIWVIENKHINLDTVKNEQEN